MKSQVLAVMAHSTKDPRRVLRGHSQTCLDSELKGAPASPLLQPVSPAVSPGVGQVSHHQTYQGAPPLKETLLTARMEFRLPYLRREVPLLLSYAVT